MSFFVELLQTFGESRAKTGWIYSTNSAVHMFSGPLGGVVIVRWGPRAAVILGGLLAGLGYLLTAFAPNIDVVFITYGFINAVGTSLNFSGWIVGLSMFWKRHHAVVMGIAMSGSGCGVFLLGPFMESIVIHYGWRGAMLICAGLSFNFCVFGATIYNTKKQTEVPKILYEEGHSLMVDIGLSENSKDIDANLAINTEETLGSFDTLMCSRQWKGEKNFIESPCLTSQTIQGSSKSLKESRLVNDNWKRLQQWISSMRNFFRCKNFNCNLIPEDSAELEEIRKLLHSPTFWLLAASCFLSFMATTTLFAVFFDWVSWIEMSETFPLALAGSGAGDLVGRLLAGTLIGRGLPPLILFSGIQLLLASTIGCAALASTNIQLIASMVGFGIACGLQSVLYALMPSQLSSGVGMARVLGYLLLVTGAGALTGPPVAGLLVDLTESYNPVLILCTAAPAAAALFNFAAHFTAKYHKRTHQIYTSPTEQTSLHM